MKPLTAIGKPLVLAAVFASTLKVSGAVDWSWWWVTAPIWLPLASVALACGIIGTCLLLMALAIGD